MTDKPAGGRELDGCGLDPFVTSAGNRDEKK